MAMNAGTVDWQGAGSGLVRDLFVLATKGTVA